ncbi:glycosyltransferase family 8 protein [Pedobacter psychroterrae]|uniref:Glycosyltransferase family 8 protein n=1 Tax=Pedobacter psychroterrae TaxID=2530453 RepID=A0A4R0NN88_9SPHI|nr:glycosyltransferase family 8 protein [Pedobacter psychroterrae]TCD01699.1 glycosyltransferase family 8 protein [Pedobacter psychroterrae]
MASTDNITIVTATDNHYMVLLAALIKSIEINHTTEQYIDFYIVGDKLSKRNINRLNASVSSDKIIVHWLEMDKIIPEGMNLPKDKSSYPSNIYMRLFIPYFLPAGIDKIIYLDVDMIALRDVSELWTIDIGTNIVGAVQDLIKTVGDPQGGIGNYHELGMDKNAKYFNTGLLIIDRKKWLDYGVTEKVLHCVELNTNFASLPDQYGLNVVLYKKWHELNPLWNTYSSLPVKSPYIIHFFHRKPIYKTYDKNQEYKEIFYQFLGQTPWKDYKPVNEWKRYVKKLMNVIQKKLSFSR